jgi:hypothetical protein
MIHKSTLVLTAGLLFVAYKIENPLLIKLILILLGLIFIFPWVSHKIDLLLKKPLLAISLALNFLILTFFYFLIFTPYALVFKAISTIKSTAKAEDTNFRYRNHEYSKSDLIRTF